MGRAEIWAVVRDIGGANAMLPIIDELKARGQEVLILATGKGVEVLIKERCEFTPVLSADDIIACMKPPHLLLTSMCGGVGRDLVPLVRGTSKVVAVQDFWGANLYTEWKDAQYWPDYIVVNDAYERAIVTEAWPGFSPSQVWALGYAAFDKYAGLDVDAVNAKARAKLGLSERAVVLYAGQGSDTPTGHMLQDVVDALNELRADCYLFPKPHPRMGKDDEEARIWQRALASFKGRTAVDWFGACGVPELIALCTKRRGVVVSLYSTMLVEAGALRAPAISMLYPDAGEASLRRQMPFEFPLTRLGAAAKAKNPAQLKDYLKLALGRKLGQETAQEKHFKIDGQNTRRAADYIMSIL